MTQKPLVSVIMNCYNSAKFLRAAIESVYAQTYPNWEIILWDNASTDATAEIAKSFDDKIQYFKAEINTPLGRARELAVQKASGDLIAFLDYDDLYLPNRLEVQIKKFWSSSAAFSYAGIQEVDEVGNVIRDVVPVVPEGEHDALALLLNQFDINVATMMIKKSALEKYNLNFDATIVASEEYNLLMRLAAREKVYAVHDCLAKWRIQTSSLTTQAISRWAFEREYTLKQIEDANPGIRSRYSAAFEEAYARAKYYRARYLISQGRKSDARATLREISRVDVRYLYLWFVLFLPIQIWDFLHKDRMKRKYLTALSRLMGKNA